MATWQSASYEGRYLQLTITETVNVAANTSTLNWTLTSTGGSANYYTVDATTVTINGTQVYYTGNISTSWLSQNAGGDKLANVIATQLLIWETVVGERDENFAKVSTGGKNAVIEQIDEHPLKSKIMSHYNRIVSSVQSHTKLPSFMAKAENSAQSLDFNWNGEKYILELTDTNNVLANYSFSASEDGIEFSINENILTISAKNLPSDSVTITANKTNSERLGIVTWTDEKIGPNGGIQDVVTYAQSVSDPVQGFVKLEKKITEQKGKITISKIGEIFSSVKESDGKYQPFYEVQGLEGATYEVTAAENITTPDGTQRYAKGDIVVTLTPDKNGTAATERIHHRRT